MRRDWILLPLLSLSTMAVIFVTAELIARRTFSESTTSLENCLVLDDSSTGVRGVPNTVCREKGREGPLVEFRLDQGGYRSGTPTTPKSAGIYRIVLIGSSIAMGERVPFDETLAALLPSKLALHSGRKIEVYNQGMAYGFARSITLRLQDALAADPDMILWVLTPIDIERGDFDYVKESYLRTAAPDRKLDAAKTAILDGIRKRGGDIVIGYALRHWLYEIQSQSQFVRSYLLNRPSDGEAGFLRSDLAPDWREHLAKFDAYTADIAHRSAAAGVPLVATFIPSRAQAALISLNEWPAGYDPYKLDRELQTIIVNHGGIYLDILPDFQRVPGAEHLYYPMDGHPDGHGHAVIADLLADKLKLNGLPGPRSPDHPIPDTDQRK